MEQWAKSIAGWLQFNLDLDEEKTEVIEYSVISIFLLFFNLAFLLFFCWILGVIKEGLIVAFTIAILRTATGGAHLSSPWRCVILSSLAPAGLGYVSSHYATYLPLWLKISMLVLLFMWGLYYISRYAPVDSEAKPIRPERRGMYKKLGIGFAIIWAVLVSLWLFFDVDTLFLASSLGFAWQILTLTPFGFQLYDLLSH